MEQHHSCSTDRDPASARFTTALRTLTGMGLAALMVGTFAPASLADTGDPEDQDTQTEDNDDAAEPDQNSEVGSDEDRDQDRDHDKDRDWNEDSDEDTSQDTDLQVEDSELILVMDASGSMNAEDAGEQTRIAAAREALTNVVDSLDQHQQVGLRVFAGEVTDPEAPQACEDSELVVEIGDDNRDELRTAIEDYQAVGARTPLAYALEQAAEDLGDEGNRTIVLVSDGEENCAPDPCEAAQAIADQGIDLAIHTVGFQIEDEESEAAREQLQCIAEVGGGDYFDANDAETLTHTLERISHRAQMPFSLHGEQVEPGTNQDNAPVLEPGAQYIGTFEAETMYYRIPRSMENSTLHVGIATYNDLGDHYDSAEIELTTMGDNRSCARDRMGIWNTSGAHLFNTAQISAVPEYDSESRDAGCWENDELLLAIHSGGRYSEGDEILGQEFELVIDEEPDPANGEDFYRDYEFNGLPWDDETEWIQMERDRDSDEQIIPGSSLNNAPLLEPGTTYDTDILPGEVQVFRVEADWNEQIQAEAFFPEPDSRLGEQLSQNYTRAHVDILSPYRGSVTDSRSNSTSDYGDAEAHIHRQDATTLHLYSYPVWWANRFEASYGSYSEHRASVAGEHYVVISADPLDENTSFTIPYRLTVDTFEVIQAETPEHPETPLEAEGQGEELRQNSNNGTLD